MSHLKKICLLEILEIDLITHDHQFGFNTLGWHVDFHSKKASSNDLCKSYAIILMINVYPDDMYLMTPTGIAMQNLLDVCHNYGIANDILFNPLKYVCIVYKPKGYKVLCPSVLIGSEPLRHVNKTK